MRPISVNRDAFHVFAINISTQMGTFVYNQAFFALLMCQMSKGCTEKSGTNY